MNPYAKKRLKTSSKPGKVVCECGKGHGSSYDGLCTKCRGGVTAFEAQQRRNKVRDQ